MTLNQNSVTQGDIKIQESILKRAIADDQQALVVMFKQFVSEDEQCYFLEYLGIEGFWGFGTHSFGCLTDRRVATVRVARFGEVTYQDGYLEFINSGVIYQPSKLPLYIYVGAIISLPFLVLFATPFATLFPWNVLLFLLVSGLAILFFPIAVKWYYRAFKCGLVFWVREGVPVYIFANRKFLRRANTLFRNTGVCREKRIKDLRK